jgi:hypothetical protein
MKKLITFSLMGFALIGCGGGSTPSEPEQAITPSVQVASVTKLVDATSLETDLITAQCSNGGVIIYTGVDSNNNGVLDTSERSGDGLVVCNGEDGSSGSDGSDGTDGLNTLITTTSFSAGEDDNCTNGGVRVDVGLDDNANNTLDSAEVDNTTYICTDCPQIITYALNPTTNLCEAYATPCNVPAGWETGCNTSAKPTVNVSQGAVFNAPPVPGL